MGGSPQCPGLSVINQTILIVDDDPVQRRLLEAAISRMGLDTMTAPGGGPALDLLFSPKGQHVSLILLDLMMPDVDGIAVLYFRALDRSWRPHPTPDVAAWREMSVEGRVDGAKSVEDTLARARIRDVEYVRSFGEGPIRYVAEAASPAV
jgi:CheY-like chemotaxis protein